MCSRSSTAARPTTFLQRLLCIWMFTIYLPTCCPCWASSEAVAINIILALSANQKNKNHDGFNMRGMRKHVNNTNQQQQKTTDKHQQNNNTHQKQKTARHI